MAFRSILGYLRKNYIISLSSLVALVCVGVFIVRNEQITRLAADYDDLSVRRSRILKNMKFASEIEADLAKMQEMMVAVDERLFHPVDLAGNQRYFYQLESATGVAMSNLQQNVKQPPSGKENKKARKRAEKSRYQEIAYEMSLSGTYEQVISFLRALEGGEAFANLNGFSIARGGKEGEQGKNLVNMRLSVEVLGSKS